MLQSGNESAVFVTNMDRIASPAVLLQRNNEAKDEHYFLLSFLQLLQTNFYLGNSLKPVQNWCIHILHAPSHFTHGIG